ncbi:hypothetical protein F5Y18DRAFT_141133 [Xylariaceae sp. FL1019]|nr:hypothetical protein F5Y18DRAFT_141133 [Xylariaceae sp. FL1019]
MPSPQSSPPTSTIERSNKGLLRGGVWYCNCSPRLPAVVRTVTRSGKNKGRTFYGCPVGQKEGNQCDFYLWSEDAREREKNALMTNNRTEMKSPPKKQMTIHESISARKEKRNLGAVTKLTKLADLQSVVKGESSTASKPVPEPASTSKSSTTAGSSTLKGDSFATSSRPEQLDSDSTSSEDSDDEEDEDGVETTPSKGKGVVYNNPKSSTMTKASAAPSAGAKRKRAVEEDDLLDDLSSGAEEELIVMTDKSTRFKDACITPSAPRTVDVDNGLPTPSLTNKGKSVRRVLFQEPEVTESTGTPSAKRQRLEDGSSASSSYKPVDATPNGKSADSASSSSTTLTTGAEGNLTQEVMSLLANENISKNTRSAVRKILDTHMSRAKGLEQGRNAARDMVKKSEAKIAQLQSRITNLEDTRREVRTKILDMYQKS